MCLLLAMKRLSLFKNHYCYEYCDVINLIFIHEIYNIHVYICNVLGEFMYNCENNKSWILIKLRKLVLFSLIPLWMAIGYPAIFYRPLRHNLLSPPSRLKGDGFFELNFLKGPPPFNLLWRVTLTN